MTGEHFLIKLAQIGLQFAVFTAVLPLITRERRPLTQHQLVGIKLILDHQFALLFSAVFPYLLFYWLLAWPELWVWRYASFLLGLFLALETAVQLLRINTLGASADIPTHSSKSMLYLLCLPAPIICAVQFVNVYFGSFAAYLTGAVWLLVPAAVQFWGLVVHLTRIDEA
jgi:hypothetical protein